MAMPAPTPVVPSRSRSTRVSKMRRSDSLVSAWARAAQFLQKLLLGLRLQACENGIGREQIGDIHQESRWCAENLVRPCPGGPAQKRRVHRPVPRQSQS